MTKKIKDNEFKDYSFEFESEVILTGINTIDYLFKEGLPKGNIVELVGETNSGKTTICMQLCSSLVNRNIEVLYIDSDASVSSQKMETIIKNKSCFTYIRTNDFSNLEKILDNYISNKNISLIVIDSICSLIHQGYTNIDNKKISITNNNTSYDSIMLTKFMKKYKALCNEKNICLLFTNDYRNKISMQLGTIKKHYGPKAVDSLSNMIIKINTNQGAFKELDSKSNNNSEILGMPCEFEIIKSNYYPTKYKIPYYLKFGIGVSNIYNWIFILYKAQIIKKSGSYYEMDKLSIKENGIIHFAKSFENKFPTIKELFKDNFENLYINIIKNI